MRINSLNIRNNIRHLPSFGDAYSTKQEEQAVKLHLDIVRDQNYQDGLRITKFYAPALPSSKEKDTGIGKLTSKEAREYYKFIKTYAGATAAKFAPIGQMTDQPEYFHKHYMGAYNRSSIPIGEDIINPFDLASEKYGNIISEQDAYEIVNNHKTIRKRLKEALGNLAKRIINFEPTLGWQNQENYPINGLLKKAYNNFKNDPNPNENLKALREEFEQFKTQKEPVDYDEIYTRLALFPVMKDIMSRVDFFKGFDSNPEIRSQRMPEYNRLKAEHADKIEFYKFKQFIAHKTLQDAKNIANEEGVELFGDCPIGFSWPETQMFPDAFMQNAEVGWGLPAINFYALRDDGENAAKNLFRAKLGHYLSHFDGIRLDVGWQYMNSRITFNNEHRTDHPDLGTKVTEFIEQTAREIRGNDFDQRKIIYEADASYDDFGIQKPEITEKLRHVKGLAVLSTEEEKNDSSNIGWGNAAYIRENLRLGDDDFILGPATHDGLGMVNCAYNEFKVNEQIGALMRIFRLREEDGVHDGWRELKGDYVGAHDHLRKYMRGRIAETTTVKHKFIQLFDLLGKEEKIDYHTGGQGLNNEIDYKNRLSRNYIADYHRDIQSGRISNMFEAQKFRMEHDGTKERNPELYARVEKFDAYLKHPGNIVTREQADELRGDLDIEKMTLEEINNLDVVV